MYIVNTLTSEKIKCTIEEIDEIDFIQIKIVFSFDWVRAKKESTIYKLVTQDSNFIHGLIGLIFREDHLFLLLIESASVNIGKNKLYDRVAGSLIAFAANLALQYVDGYMLMIAKTELIDYYRDKFGFIQLGSTSRMISFPHNSENLVNSYYD